MTCFEGIQTLHLALEGKGEEKSLRHNDIPYSL
jgi:hypothetical protein